MAKRTDLKKILIIGSGPIIIGQAAEFDYAGTQACLALKEEGYEVVLCNSNPATIMTDTTIADKVYMEPLTLEYIAKIIRYERPDAIVPGIGGQTGLNLAMQLEKKGILKECHTELLGTSSESIERAEDRELFKQLCQEIGEPVIPSRITYDLEEAKKAAEEIGYPDIELPDVNAQKVKLSEVDAKVIMVYFWSATDANQKMFNLDVLKSLYEDYHKRGFEIYQVALDPDKASWAQVVKQQALPWINVCDGLGGNSPYVLTYNLGGLPSAYIISDGELVDGQVVDEKSLRKLIDKLLK